MRRTSSQSPRTARRGIVTLAALAALTLTIACGGDPEADAASAADSPAATASTAAETGSETSPASLPATATANDAASAVAATTASPAKAAPRLTSIGSGPVAAGDLRDAYFHWKGETLTVGGYPHTPMSSAYWSSSMQLAATPDAGAKALLSCQMRENPEGRIARDTPLVFRGRMQGRSFAVGDGDPPMLQLQDCEVVSVGEPLGQGTSPWEIDGSTVLVGDLHEAAFGWHGETVAVTGGYWGSTHSSASDTTQHDLKDAAGKKAVGCMQAGKVEAPADVLANREGVVIEGTLDKPFFDQVVLTDCRFVERS